MTALKKLNCEKKYVIGIFASGIIYIAVRCLFAIDTDLFGISSHPATAGATAFCSVYTLLLCAVLSVAVVFCPKKGIHFSPAAPFILICGLGICRFYVGGTEYSPAAILFIVTLACNLISSMTGVGFSGVVGIITAFFLTPALVPSVCAAVSIGSVCYINSENIKKKNLSYLSVALNLLLTLALCGYSFSHSGNTADTEFDTQAIVIAGIFTMLYLVPVITAFVKKSGVCDKLTAVLIFLTFGLSLILLAYTGEISAAMTVICSAALPVTAAVFIKEECCPQLNSLTGKLAENKPLYMLSLAFFVRATAFFIVNFEEVIG